MKEKLVAILLHFYQPYWQFPEYVIRAIEKSYIPVSRAILKSEINLTVNITSCLLEREDEFPRLKEFRENIGEAANNGKIEFTHSSAYHAFFPMLEQYPWEIQRQIELNAEKSREIFGGTWNARGLFSPEMGISPSVLKLARALGISWTIADAPVYDFRPKLGQTIPYNLILGVEGLPLFFRSQDWSDNLSQRDRAHKLHGLNLEMYAHKLYEAIDFWVNNSSGYIIIAMDGETFGEHINEYTEDNLKSLFQTLFHLKDLRLATLSELVETFPIHNLGIEWEHDFKGSWSTSVENLREGIAYPLWSNPHNNLHSLQWALTYSAIEATKLTEDFVQEHKVPENMMISYQESRVILDRALNSCQYWWAARGFHGTSEDKARVATIIHTNAFDLWQLLVNNFLLLIASNANLESRRKIFEIKNDADKAFSAIDEIVSPYL